MVTKEKLDNLLQAFEYPCAWNLFKEPQVPPYILYGNGESGNIYSDERVLRQVDTFEITLCHSDYEERKKLEDYLTESGIVWERFSTDVYVNTEDLFQTIYEVI